MARRRSSGSLQPRLGELSEAIDEAIGEVSEEIYAGVDAALDKAARHMAQALETATPVETGKTRSSWEVDFRYKNVRYINNTSVNEQGVPIVNLLEFGKKGKPFVRRTVQAEQDNIINIIKGEIEHGNTE